MSSDVDTYLDTYKAAEFLGKAPQTLRSWRSAGTGPPYYKLPGGSVGYKVAQLIAWRDARTKQVDPETPAQAVQDPSQDGK